MINIVALGTPACKLAKEFESYKEYTLYTVDDEQSADLVLPSGLTPEEYESKEIKIPTSLKRLKGEALFIVAGSSAVSTFSLKLLECLSKKCNIKVVYLCVEDKFLSDVKIKQSRVVKGVLQEYARSGIFEELSLISNSVMEELVGPSTIYEIYDKVNQMIAYNYHMINVLDNLDPLISTFGRRADTSRIVSYGVFDCEKGEIFSFFPLDFPHEIRYYYSIPKKQLESEKDLVKNRTSNLAVVEGGPRVSYAFYESSLDAPYGVVLQYSSKIQK